MPLIHVIVSILAIIIIIYALNRPDTSSLRKGGAITEGEKSIAVLETRQDTRLIASLLCIIIVLLALIADKL